MLRYTYISLFCLLPFLFSGCTESEITPRTYPRVETLAVNEITLGGAVFEGRIMKDGTEEIVQTGFVWSEKEDPRIHNSEKVVQPYRGDRFSASIRSTLIDGHTYYVRAFVRSDSHIIYGEEVSFISRGSANPSIYSIVPSRGTWGDTVRVSGMGFSYIPENNLVLFGNKQAVIISITDTLLTCIVPDMIEDEAVWVSVRVGAQITRFMRYKYELLKPVIDQFSPGEVTFGDEVAIIGRHFSEIPERNTVHIGGKPAVVISSSPQSLLVQVPNTLDSQVNRISVEVNMQEAYIDGLMIAEPIISGISKQSGFSGDIIDIIGSNFNPEFQYDTVLFENTSAEIISGTREQITVRVPQGIFTKREIPVRLRFLGQTYTVPDKFQINDTWIEKAAIPHEGESRLNGVSFRFQGFGYAGLGFQGYYAGVSDEIWKYDPAINQWEYETAYPGQGRNYVIHCSTDQYLYMGGGDPESSLNLQTDFYRYSGQEWTRLADLPVASLRGTLIESGNFLYLLSSHETKKFWRYDISANAWAQVNFPATLNFNKTSAGFALDGKLYFVTERADFLSYDPVANSWVRLTAMPEIPNRTSAGILNGKGYVLGGNNLYFYEVSTDSWTKISTFSGQNGWTRVNWYSFVVNGKLYAGGGKDEYEYHTDWWEYDPAY